MAMVNVFGLPQATSSAEEFNNSLSALGGAGGDYARHKMLREEAYQDAVRLAQAKQNLELTMQQHRMQQFGQFLNPQEQAPQPQANSQAVMSLAQGGVGDINANPVPAMQFGSMPTQQETSFQKMNRGIEQKFGSNYEVNPNFLMTGKGTGIQRKIKSENSFLLGMKQDQFNQREFDKIIEKNNPYNASSRTPIGMAGRAALSASRALQRLNDTGDLITNQDAGNIQADIASIFQNGSPTEFGMSEQQYHTLYGKVQGIRQYLTGKPENSITPEIRQRLIKVISDIQRTNVDVVKNNFSFIEKSKSNVIKPFQDQWDSAKQDLLDKFNFESSAGLSNQSGQGMTATNPKTGQRIKSLDGGQTWQPLQ